MATYRKRVVETVTKNEFTLTLSQEEAEALYAVTGAIGGPLEKRRGKIENIRNVLYNSGISSGYGFGVTGSVYLDKD